MIYHIAEYLVPYWSPLNVVHYVSFRAIASLLTSLFFSFLLGNRFIELSKRLFRAKAREWTPQTHKAKDDMPTMGGIFILGIVMLNILLWNNLTNPYLWIFMFGMLGFGTIGFLDDWHKIKYRRGISASYKFCLQLLVSTLTIGFLLMTDFSTTITIPFFKWLQPNLGYFFVLWGVFLMIGCSNAVNLTDGLDGLAITSLIPNFATFAAICYLAGHYKLAAYLHIPFAGSAEIAIVGTILVGSSIGFLWYNAYPAQIFMGDVGSLALGSALALMALLGKNECLLVISGGLFVMETISVIVQIASYKWFGKRIFKMAPIHHHFELLGWQESKITVRFGIISLILCLLALITLKIR